VLEAAQFERCVEMPQLEQGNERLREETVSQIPLNNDNIHIRSLLLG